MLLCSHRATILQPILFLFLFLLLRRSSGVTASFACTAWGTRLILSRVSAFLSYDAARPLIKPQVDGRTVLTD